MKTTAQKTRTEELQIIQQIQNKARTEKLEGEKSVIVGFLKLVGPTGTVW